MHASLHNRLSKAENDFFSATGRGGLALAAFHDSWSSLCRDLDHSSRTNSLDTTTSTLWQTTATRVNIASEHLLDLKSRAKSITSAYQDELDAIFARVNLDTADSRLPETDDSTQPDSSSKQPYPSYIEPAYFWLLKNLHDPYPSKEIRESITRSTGPDRKAVDAWFVHARKRIGWNALRKERFANKRIEIVDAATRFFLHQDEKRPVDANIEIEFAAIEKRAKDLYSARFTESTLALQLDLAVKDSTPEMKVRIEEPQGRRKEQEKRAADWSITRAASSYPSPAHSPSCTPGSLVSSPQPYEDDLETMSIPPTGGQKRRCTSVDFYDEGGAGNPRKRSRYDIFNVLLSSHLIYLDRLEAQLPMPLIGLPSPALSTQGSFEHIGENFSQPTVPSTDSIPVPLTSSRKRRLSDADGQGLPKRPRNLAVGPRMHAVSDPFPMSSALFEASSMDDWFHSNFGITNAFHIDELDTTLPLDVEVFEYPEVDPSPQRTAVSTPVSLAEPRE